MNKILLGVVVGALGTALGMALAGYLTIVNGWIPARGDVVPDKFEAWAAHHALKATLVREGTDKAPMQADAVTLMAGAKVYGSNCSGCHGAPGNATPAFAAGFNPHAPLFANGDDVTDDPEGYIYWKVNHGIKFTGMPSFNKMLSEKEMWQVTLFLKNQNKLPTDVATCWKAMK
jgi:thiosulfate dehydrogenase